MTEITLTDARDRLAFVVDQSRREPVYLTRGNVRVAVVVDTDSLARLLSDAEELADIRAVDPAWDETDRLGETPIPWKDVTREVGL
ncbi:type II toxin-antitoxin system Phd/YefM family antitoxin [Microbacterium sp. A84]|uniref:type II toxin-antitoxin system Phd/YefM family antitoxin n=1 Tax=Microbacterium sp. A84 TaxID=3450715 RepID=UPI003F41C432